MRQPTLRHLSRNTTQTFNAVALCFGLYSTLLEGQTLNAMVQSDLNKCYEQHGPNVIRSIFASDNLKPTACDVKETIYPNAYKKLDKIYDDKITLTDEEFRSSLDVHDATGLNHSIEGDNVNFSVKTNVGDKNHSTSLAPPLKGYTQIQTE